MTRLRWFAVCSLIILISIFALGCGGSSEEEDTNYIKVGVVGPMGFVQGDHSWYGAELAKEEINAAGGIKVGDVTYMIQTVKVDTNELQSVDDAVSAVERAISVDKVDLFVGGFRTEAVLPMTDLAVDHNKIFMIAGAATRTLLEGRVDQDYDRYKYLFRIAPPNNIDLVKLSFILLNEVANQVRAELEIDTPRVAILMEMLTWNEPLVQVAQQQIPAMGMELVGVWRPSATATDISTELTEIQTKGAHIIYMANSGPVAITYGRQWGELEIPACSVGLSVESQKLGYLVATGGFGEYDMSLNTYGRAKATDKTIPFWDKFVETYNDTPSHSAATYDALYLIKEAIEKAGTLDPDAVVEELENTDYEGALGRVVFDPVHDLIWGPGYVTGFANQWQNGSLVTVWPYNWSPVKDLNISYEGAVPYKIPPRVIEYWKDR
jgi:branched-chain amino acid transport system substrate-binding protein